MSTAQVPWLFAVVCAGLGLFLVGVVNLLLLRCRGWVRVPGTILAVGLSLAAAAALDRTTLERTALLLVAGLLPCAAFASGRFVDGLAAAVSATRRPAIRFGVLTAAGIGTAIGGVAVQEELDRKAAEEMTAELAAMDGNTPSTPTDRATAVTDRGTAIVLKEAVSAREEPHLGAAELKVLASAQLNHQIIRRGAGGDHSNCHGWVFTDGRFRLSPEDVDLILRENGYQEVVEPRAGDVVIYRRGGGIVHSGIVRYVTEGQPVLVEGKWGSLGVLLHTADRSLYGNDYTFYRSDRNGHLLLGLGGVPASGEARPSAATE